MWGYASTGRALFIGAVGAGIAVLLQMPLALLAGPALLVAIAALMGQDVECAQPVREAGFTIVGIAIGSLVTQDSITAMSRWPLAFLAIALLMPFILISGRALLSRFFGFERNAALLATSPGHLSFVVAMTDDLGFPVAQVAMVQAIRLLSLTLVVPTIAVFSGLDIGIGLRPSSSVMPWSHLGLLILGVVILSPLAKAIRLPAPRLLTGMILSAGAHLLNLTSGGMAPTLAQIVLVVMGTLIGTRFAGMTLTQLRKFLWAGLGITLIAVLATILFAIPAAIVTGLPLMDVLVAFAPGGLETMILIGAAIGADPSFVAAAHVTRLLILPGLVGLMLGRKST